MSINVGGGRKTLAQQLKQLESNELDSPLFGGADIDNDLDEGILRNTGDRQHYLDVGPSRLRSEVGNGNEGAAQTLLGEKYKGEVRGRMKIFDDDDEEEEDEEDEGDEEDVSDGINGEDDEEEDEENDEEDDDDEEEEDEEEEDNENEDEDEDSEGGGDDEDNGDGMEIHKSTTSISKSTATLDPLAALRDSRVKDIAKGKAIKQQKKLFSDLLTARITFHKAWSTHSKFPSSAEDGSEELDEETKESKADTLKSLAQLSEQLFKLREEFVLPGTDLEGLSLGLGKRKRDIEDDSDTKEEYSDLGYWEKQGKDSLAITEASRQPLLNILNKWSSKIQAATAQVGGKQGSSKFLQGTKGQTGIIEAIETGLIAKRDSEKTFYEQEEAHYRALLREVIETRAGGGAGPDTSHLRKEKKKKRDAERGASKGRKIRYTVHEKAQNFVVPIPLSHGWHEEQVDELFSSLFGGVGLHGASSEAVITTSGVSDGEGLAGLGGLRVF